MSTRIWAPISLATMWASVVLPRPGGPEKEDVVERLPPLPGAASMKTPSVSRSFGWPMNSVRALGRNVTSAARSLGPERHRKGCVRPQTDLGPAS